ncbi:MAG: serine/threonine protein kinase [Armatimonadetes bacterium]|nr:serine/threonine protein kinase [Armatimonadota bacterium]
MPLTIRLPFLERARGFSLSEFTPQTVIDSRYKIIKLIKIGGMGAVYQAEDLILERKICALKGVHTLLKINSAEYQIAVSRFLREIQVLTNLVHPNIPQITDHFFEDDYFYFVMDYIKGIDLAEELKKEGSPGLPEATVINWTIQILEALDYLHNLSPPVIHSDIKPSNLILREEDQKILLIDFGIARAAGLNKGNWLGTLGYASPEQMEGEKLSPLSDLYSLGAAIYELLSGDKAYNLNQSKIAGLEVNFNLKNILQKLLNFKIKERFQSAKEVIEKFKEVIEMFENDYKRFKYL